MDMEAGKTLTNEEVIRELLELLKKNAMKGQANDVFEICTPFVLFSFVFFCFVFSLLEAFDFCFFVCLPFLPCRHFSIFPEFSFFHPFAGKTALKQMPSRVRSAVIFPLCAFTIAAATERPIP